MSEDRRRQTRAHGGAGAALGHGRTALSLALCLALLWAGFGASAALGQAVCDVGSVFLRNPDGRIARFSVEIADDDAERAQGLMNRDAMAASKGMLFVYDAPRRVNFWMKNTRIALDMLFVDATGQVLRVHPMAKPMDTTSISGGEGVQFVLEINGGLAGQLGLVPGSVLRHPAIDQGGAIWPCTP